MSARRALLGALGLVGVALALTLVALGRDERRPARAEQVAAARETSSSILVETPAAAPRADEPAVSAVSAVTRESVLISADAPTELSFRREDLYATVLDTVMRSAVVGATVVVFESDRPFVRGSPVRAMLATDRHGHFHLPVVGALKRLPVLVEAEGHCVEVAWLQTGRAEEMLLTPAVTISGRVLRASDRQPAAGVELYWSDGLRWDGTELVPNRFRTDAEGRFELSAVPADQTLTISIAEQGSFPDRHSLTTGSESVSDLELLLGSTLPRWLRLVELETGVPLANFRGRFRFAGPFETDGTGLVSVRFAPDGYWVHSGGVRLAIESDSTCTTRIDLSVDDRESIQDVPLSRGAIVAGRVRDAQGVPIGGAKIYYSTNGAFAAPGQERRSGLPPGVVIEPPQSHSATADAEGAFALDRLFPPLPVSDRLQSAQLRVSCPGWLPFVQPLEVPPAGTTSWIDVVLERGGSLSGRVLRDGAPFPGAEVQAGQGESWRSCTTNDGGEYLLEPLGAGVLSVSVSTDGSSRSPFQLLQQDVTLGPGEHQELDLLVTDTRVAIAGHVRDESGAPFAGATVFVRGEFLFMTPVGVMSRYGDPSTSTAKDGAFELLVANDPAPIEIVAWRAGVETSTRAVPGSSEIELVLSRPETLRLSIQDDEGRSIDALHHVQWWPAGVSKDSPPTGVAAWLSPLSDGSFEIELPPGRWDLELSASGRASAQLFDVPVVVGASNEAQVTMDAGITLELHFATDGPAPPDPRLSLVTAVEQARIDAEDELMGFIAGMRRLRPSGQTLVVPGLRPGLHVLRSAREGWSLEPARFDLPEVERHVVDVRWVRTEGER